MTWITPDQKVEMIKDIYCSLLKNVSDVARSPLTPDAYNLIAKQSIIALDEFIKVCKEDGLIK